MPRRSGGQEVALSANVSVDILLLNGALSVE